MKLDLHILFNQVHMDNELTGKGGKKKEKKKRGITDILN